MKIAYLSRGGNVYDRRFLEKMVERGHEAYFISYFPGEKVDVEGVESYFYDYRSMYRFKIFISFQTALHLRKLLKHICPDILHTGWIPDMGYFGALSGFNPTLAMPWGSDILLKPYESRVIMWKTQYALRHANMITCDCELVKNKIIQLSGCSPDKIVIFPWGIDLQTFRPSDTGLRVREKLGWHGNKILIMTRSMDKPLYGHSFFIKALIAIIQEVPETRVIFLGSGMLESEFRKTIIELGLKEYIYFAGFVNDVTMAEYLNAADVYVSAAISDGSSCSLLEAMASQLPVVVTDAPANFEWVDDGVNGFIVPRKDSNVLADQLIKLLKNENLQRKMGQCNLEIAIDRADWENNFNILEGIYKDLVSKTKR